LHRLSEITEKLLSPVIALFVKFTLANRPHIVNQDINMDYS